MSQNVYNGKDFSITNFYGGAKRGACVQITLNGEWRDKGYLQITRKELEAICEAVRQDKEVN